jgi:hypothetical protein
MFYLFKCYKIDNSTEFATEGVLYTIQMSRKRENVTQLRSGLLDTRLRIKGKVNVAY